MRRDTLHRSSLAIALLLASAAPAWGQDFTKQDFPQDLVKRPLVLAPGMVEARVGGQSDFLGTDAGDVRTRFDILWSPVNRMMLGLETDVQVTNGFALNDVNVWYEYNLFPGFSARGGGYMQVPDDDPMVMGDEDPTFGFRIGGPIKARLSQSLAIVTTPRWGMEANGLERQFLDLPVGAQVQLLPQMALFGSVGFTLINWELDLDSDNPDAAQVPLIAGVVLTPTRLFDMAVELRMPDVANRSEDRWVMAWLGFRK